MLPLFDQNRAYTLQDTLTLANTMNQSISSYYEQTLSLITDYVESDGTVSITTEISNLGAMANKDRNELSKYVGVFSAYSGDLFINSTIDRFDNLINLYGNVFEGVEPTQLARTVNGYIDIENQISIESKEDLIMYLTTNNIDYVDNGDYVSFSTQDVEEADAENTEGATDEEVPETTIDSDVNNEPENDDAEDTESPVESNSTESVEPTASLEAQ